MAGIMPALLCLITISTGSSAIKLASYYNDHMVLQMAPQRATIWGYAEKSVQINVTLDGKEYRTVSSNIDGRWMVAFDPMAAGGPYIISIQSIEGDNDDVIQLNDVMFGDVWICGGQSNMAQNVASAINSRQELARSYNYPHIRLFAVKRHGSNVPLDDIKSAYLKWSLPTPVTLGKYAGRYDYFSAVCWFYGRDLYDHFQRPIGLIDSNWGGTPVEAWSSQDALDECQGGNRKKRAFRDTVLWNGMIHPLRRMVIKGAIWYQGESNAPAPDTYNCTFPAMIDDWREKWYQGTGGLTDRKFPFGFVQISTSNLVQPGLIGNYPILRWHQTADFGYAPNDRMQNVFMAVSIDLPDPTSPFEPIHPRYKQDVGKRLALASRAVAYGEDNLVYAGPFPTTITTTDSELTIEFDNGTANITIINNDGFEVCCSATFTFCRENDRRWSPAIVEKLLAPSIVKFSHTCERNVTQVRYLWREYPCTLKACSIYSVENTLPTPPFIYNLSPPYRSPTTTNNESKFGNSAGNSQTNKDRGKTNIVVNRYRGKIVSSRRLKSGCVWLP